MSSIAQRQGWRGESVALFMILNWANSSLHKGCSHVVDYSTAQVRLTHDATPIDRLSVTLLYLYVFLAQFGHLLACSCCKKCSLSSFPSFFLNFLTFLGYLGDVFFCACALQDNRIFYKSNLLYIYDGYCCYLSGKLGSFLRVFLFAGQKENNGTNNFKKTCEYTCHVVVLMMAAILKSSCLKTLILLAGSFLKVFQFIFFICVSAHFQNTREILTGILSKYKRLRQS